MTQTSQDEPTTKPPHFATLLLMAMAPEEIGKRIRTRREELGWTHDKLAQEMSVGLRTVQRWQKGRNPANGKSWLPRLGTLMDLADVMQVERSYFVEGQQVQANTADRLAALEALATESVALTRRALELLGEPPAAAAPQPRKRANE